MSNMQIMNIYWTLTAIFFIGVISFFLRRIYLAKHSEKTKSNATKVFRRHGAIRNWKVLTDVTLGVGDQAITADQLVIGPFGVIVACDLHQKGNVYGDLTAPEWILATGEDANEKKTRIVSPYHTAEQGVEQLRSMFAKAKIYSVPVELMVPKTQKQGSYITGSSQYLFSCKELKTQLEKSRFEKDNGVDIEAVAALFNS
ncbi:MAG: nuclease-related domain-containing protein [Angelakisella sp.]